VRGALSAESETSQEAAGSLLEILRSRPVVLFGAGVLGQRISRALRMARIEPQAFADNNPGLHGKQVDGVAVMAPVEAARRFGSAGVFIIAVWRPAHSGGLCDIDGQLRALGCELIIPFVPVLWLFPQQLLPHYLWDAPSRMDGERHAIETALALFDDDSSRREFLAQIEFRRTGDFRVLPPIEKHPQYFPDFIKPHSDECFVDCGAYDGDSIASFLKWSRGQFRKVIAFEADPVCFEKLREFASGLKGIAGQIECHAAAVASGPGTVRFNATGQAGASISDEGGIEVKSVALDEALQAEQPTFIKMDIEGAEAEALRGAQSTIRRCQPILAVCVYHNQSDLWRLPLLMRELLPEARLFLRSYCLDGLDTVCYAVPRHRLT
jgi:FkbM family methyltransferase